MALLDEIRQRRTPTTILLVSLALVAASMSYRPSPRVVAMTVEASAAILDTSEQVTVEQTIPLKPPGLVLGTVERAAVDGVVTENEQALGLINRSRGTGLTLTRLALSPGARLGMRADEAGCQALAITRGEGEIEFSVAGRNSDDERSVVVGIAASPSGASEFTLCPRGPWSMPLVGVSRVEFARRVRSSATQSFAMSSLLSAKVSFPTLDVERKVTPLHGLAAEGMQGGRPMVIEASSKPAALKLDYVGEAESVLTGEPGEQRSLMPTALEHLIGKSPVAALLAAFAFFWGSLWGIVSFWRVPAKA